MNSSTPKASPPDSTTLGPLRVGVVGVGYLGQHHARIYHELPQCELIGIMDIDRERAKAIGRQYGCPYFDTIEDLGAACDAVSVAVPTDWHCAVALPLMAKACHLLIEKPLCTSLEEGERILEAAKKHYCLVQVGHVEHFNPVMAFMEKAVTQPLFITADRLAPFTPRGTEVGVVLDLMIHDIGIILQLVKAPIESIDAVGVHVLTATEDIANARLRFADGCVANLNSSRISTKKLREIRIFQPNAYLSLDFMNQNGHLMTKEGMTFERQEIPIDKGEPLRREISAFLESVARRSQPKVDAALGKSALEVAIQITEQIRAVKSDTQR